MSKRSSDRLPLGLSIPEAAAALSMSREAFRTHVLPHVRVVYLGRLVRIDIRELERYLEEHGVRLPS